MDRLTERFVDGSADIIEPDSVLDENGYDLLEDAIERLAAYEDTGLTPKEIIALKADNERLHRLVDNIECVMIGDRQ